jgi:DNA-directed RNA polymerase specialized sigma24 family protein
MKRTREVVNWPSTTQNADMTSDGPPRSPSRFHTTRWTLILAVQARDEGGRAALADLCTAYWTPVYAYLRASGRSTDVAEDLTQGFFTTLIEKGYVEQADRTRGRFRSFLLTAVKHYLANEHDAATAAKRGGGLPIASLDAEDGEAHFRQAAAQSVTPDRVFEHAWASRTLAAARRRLLDAHDAGWMRGSRFFGPLLSQVVDGSSVPFSTLAAQLQTSEGSLRVLAHRMRQQWGRCLQEVVADTVDDEPAAQEELRYLLQVLERR